MCLYIDKLAHQASVIIANPTGCHTQAKSLDKLMERAKEALELCLEIAGARKERSSTYLVRGRAR